MPTLKEKKTSSTKGVGIACLVRMKHHHQFYSKPQHTLLSLACRKRNSFNHFNFFGPTTLVKLQTVFKTGIIATSSFCKVWFKLWPIWLILCTPQIHQYPTSWPGQPSSSTLSRVRPVSSSYPPMMRAAVLWEADSTGNNAMHSRIGFLIEYIIFFLRLCAQTILSPEQTKH